MVRHKPQKEDLHGKNLANTKEICITLKAIDKKMATNMHSNQDSELRVRTQLCLWGPQCQVKGFLPRSSIHNYSTLTKLIEQCSISLHQEAQNWWANSWKMNYRFNALSIKSCWNKTESIWMILNFIENLLT